MKRFAPPIERCTRCARQIHGGGDTCGECLCQTSPLAVERCVAAVDYRYPWDGLIARFKFRNEPGWAATLAEPMWRQARAQALTTPQSLWVPVPVSPARLAERGYKQAWELCRALQRRSGLCALADALVRIADAPDQHRLPPAQRLSNLRGAFAVHPAHMARLHNAHVVLVDDVRTTGATLENAALAMRQAGCAGVRALVFARTPHHSDRSHGA
jgi:ComF family protein